MGPATLTPGAGGGAENSLLWPTQVSIYLDVLDVHFTDVNEGDWPHPG